MKKHIYIYIVLVIVSNFFNLRFLPAINYDSNESLILIIIVITLGYILFPHKYSISKYPIVRRYTQYLKYIWLSIGITLLTCYLFWNQGFIQSVLTYRRFISYLFYFVLLWIVPSVDDIIKGFKYYTYTFLLIAFCIWVLRIPMTNTVIDPYAETSMNNAILGTSIILFYFYHLLMKLEQRFNWKDFIIVSCIMIYYIVNQNRSLMFPCLIFYIYTLFHKIRGSVFLKIFIMIFILGVLYINYDMIEAVIDETKDQTNNEKYVRWLAIDYFITDLSPNIICSIFGNGIISRVSNPDLWNYLYSNMLNFNDVGWFGYYAFFGLTGIIAAFNIIIRIILNKKSHSDLRMLLIHMLFPTIWCLWMPDTIILFCIIIYIFIYRKIMIDAENNVEYNCKNIL